MCFLQTRSLNKNRIMISDEVIFQADVDGCMKERVGSNRAGLEPAPTPNGILFYIDISLFFITRTPYPETPYRLSPAHLSELFIRFSHIKTIGFRDEVEVFVASSAQVDQNTAMLHLFCIFHTIGDGMGTLQGGNNPFDGT